MLRGGVSRGRLERYPEEACASSFNTGRGSHPGPGMVLHAVQGRNEALDGCQDNGGCSPAPPNDLAVRVPDAHVGHGRAVGAASHGMLAVARDMRLQPQLLHGVAHESRRPLPLPITSCSSPSIFTVTNALNALLFSACVKWKSMRLNAAFVVHHSSRGRCGSLLQATVRHACGRKRP